MYCNDMVFVGGSNGRYSVCRILNGKKKFFEVQNYGQFEQSITLKGSPCSYAEKRFCEREVAAYIKEASYRGPSRAS